MNTKKLAAAGIKLSSLTTFDAFDKAVATLRTKLPKSDPVIEFGTKDYGAIHFLGGIQGAYGTAAPIRDWIYHVPGSTWVTPQNTKALQKMADWAKAGIFNSDRDAVTYDDAAKLFAKGKGVFLYEGDWQTAVVSAGLGKDVSIINMPPGPSGKHVGIGATSGPVAHLGQDEVPGPRSGLAELHHRLAGCEGLDVQARSRSRRWPGPSRLRTTGCSARPRRRTSRSSRTTG